MNSLSPSFPRFVLSRAIRIQWRKIETDFRNLIYYFLFTATIRAPHFPGSSGSTWANDEGVRSFATQLNHFHLLFSVGPGEKIARQIAFSLLGGDLIAFGMTWDLRVNNWIRKRCKPWLTFCTTAAAQRWIEKFETNLLTWIWMAQVCIHFPNIEWWTIRLWVPIMRMGTGLHRNWCHKTEFNPFYIFVWLMGASTALSRRVGSGETPKNTCAFWNL